MKERGGQDNKTKRTTWERIRSEELNVVFYLSRGGIWEKSVLRSKNGRGSVLPRGVHGGFVKAYSRHQPVRAEQESAA